MEQFQISSYSKMKIIQFFFSVVGISFYLALIILFHFYYDCIRFIKEKIFSFILVHSLTSLISLFIKDPTYNLFFNYFSHTFQLYLFLYFIDKCLVSSPITIDKGKMEIEYKIYIILIFMLCTFPFNKYFGLFEKTFLDQNAISMILSILFYEQIRGKMQFIIYILNERKALSANPDMPYEMIFYYYNMYKMINNYFYTSFLFFLLMLGAKILENFVQYKITFQFIAYFLYLSAIYTLVIGCILFFYCLNRKDLNYKKRNKREKLENIDERQKFTIIDVESNYDDIDENMNFALSSSNDKRKKKNKNNKIKHNEKINFKQYEEDKGNKTEKE